MKSSRRAFAGLLASLVVGVLFVYTWSALKPTRRPAPATTVTLQKRWLFVWRDMSDPKEVDRMIARFPRAQADGYNGVAFAANIPSGKAAELKAAAKRHGLDLIAIVMGGSRDSNFAEGVLSEDALFVAHGETASFQPDNPTRVVNGDFESVTGNHFNDWSL